MRHLAQRSRFLPASRLGRWSASLFGGTLVAFLTMVALVAAGQRGGETFSDNLWLSIPGAIAAVGAVGAFLTGALALVRSRERSLVTVVVTLVSALVVVFLVGELLVPH